MGDHGTPDAGQDLGTGEDAGPDETDSAGRRIGDGIVDTLAEDPLAEDPLAEDPMVDTDYEAGNLNFDEVRYFVEHYVLPWVKDRVEVARAAWCSSWEDHPEVVMRLIELAASRVELFEGQERDGEVPDRRHDIARWWVDVFDRHLEAITALDGPLRRCRWGHRGTGGVPLGFADMETWFLEWFAKSMTRRPTDVYWCERWDRHAEVVLQLTELWIAWEAARRTPGAFLSWWESAHRCFAQITKPDGPMAACRQGRSHVEASRTLDGRPMTADA